MTESPDFARAYALGREDGYRHGYGQARAELDRLRTENAALIHDSAELMEGYVWEANRK